MVKLDTKQGYLLGLDPMLLLSGYRLMHGLPPEMTGTMKAQHLGVLFAIILLDKSGTEPTTKNISNFLTMVGSNVSRIANRLAALGVVSRQQMRASHGKGHQYCYRPVLTAEQV